MQRGRQALALREWKIIGSAHRGRAAAGLLLLIHHLVQAAVLKHHALAWLHAVVAAFKDAGDQNVWRVDACVIHAGVAIGAQADAHLRRAGAADEDAEVGRHQDVGVAAGGEAGFDRAVIDGHHEAGDLAGGDAGVGGQLDGGRRADTQRAAVGQGDLGGVIARRDGSAGGDEGSAVHDLHAAGHLGRCAGNLAVEGHNGDGTGRDGRALGGRLRRGCGGLRGG